MAYATARRIEGVGATDGKTTVARSRPEPPARAVAAAAALDAKIDQLVDDYSDLIRRVSYTHLASTHDADDICQTVFMRLITLLQRDAHHFSDAEHEKAWIIRATINACKDQLKSAHRQRTQSLEESKVDGAERQSAATCQTAQTSTDLANEPTDLMDAVSALPIAYRQAIYLYYYEGYSVREIAAITDESHNAVYAHLSRGRTKLREMLKGENR